MNKQDILEYSYMINRGILKANIEFEKGKEDEITYDFKCPEYQKLIEKYSLKKIAGKGSDFEKAKRLLAHFSKRLKHDSMYDNHIPCNSLDLLEYSYENKEHGINCLNKSKILAELCLALGIKARRIIIMPYSIYDLDNHVVTEIFDTNLNKWIMLDPSNNSYFIDEKGIPLSMPEIRNKFAENEFITFVHTSDKLDDLEKLSKKYLSENWYICKNSYWFIVEKYQGFGVKEERMYFVPKGFSINKWNILNSEYKLDTCKKYYPDMVDYFTESLEKAKKEKEVPIYSISVLK